MRQRFGRLMRQIDGLAGAVVRLGLLTLQRREHPQDVCRRIGQALGLVHDPHQERLGGVLLVHEARQSHHPAQVGDVVAAEHRGDPALHALELIERQALA